MIFRGSHVVSTEQFSAADIGRLFELARRMEPYAQRRNTTSILNGAVLGNLFFEPSTRTRVSFAAAFARLGGTACDTTGFQFSSMAKGESLADTARVISGYVDVIVLRHPVEGSVAEFAAASTVPVISGGDGPGEHPTQALLDLYTIVKETQRPVEALAGLRLAMLGDLRYGRTVHSLAKLLGLFPGVEFSFIAPPELQMPETIVRRLTDKGFRVNTATSLAEGLLDADVVYVTRLQQERFTVPEDAEKYRGVYRIDARTVERYCKPGAVLMHPLPRDSRPEANELDEDLNSHPNLAIFRQADNGIPVRMALFALVMGVDGQVGQHDLPVPWFNDGV